MAAPKLSTMLTRGDRAPNFFLADQRNAIINLADKARGGPILVLLCPSAKDPGCATELDALFAAAPEMLDDGAHVFAVLGDPQPVAQKLAETRDAKFHIVSDRDHKVAGDFGARGKLVGFVLSPDQRVRAVLPVGKTPIAERAGELLSALKPPPPFAAPVHPPILSIPDVFSPEECALLIAEAERRGTQESGTLRMVDGRMVQVTDGETKRRRDHYVTDKDLLDFIGARFQKRVVPEVGRAFHATIRYIEEFKIVRYDSEVGGFFRAHRDNTTLGTAHRRFAMTLNLNSPDYEGGELRFPEYGNASYKPGIGEAVIFSCNLLHEAADVTAGVRYVLLSFIYDEGGKQILERNRKLMAERGLA